MSFKRAIAVYFVVAGVLLTAGAFADLQNVTVGGQITILGEYFRSSYTPDSALRWPANWLTGRAIGMEGNEIYSDFSWDKRVPASRTVGQWTRLHLQADFTDNVQAYVELDSVNEWGEDFRSNYLTGIDSRADSTDDVELYQGYIDISEMFGTPLKLRIGRQELSFGSEWLVGNNDNGPVPRYGLSFDAVRLTYAAEKYSIDAWWAKLAERSPLEEDGDTDFAGVYASYTGIENITLDAYWLWLRDASALQDTNGGAFSEWVEGLAGVDNYDATSIHTVGLRGAGTLGAFDFELEAAYQFGDAGQVGYPFKPVVYGDNDAEYDAWTVHAVSGYTFDIAWKPRPHLDYVYFSGEDNRADSPGQWLEAMFNPFYRGSSVTFNRLFSDYFGSFILDGTDMSNVHLLCAGVDINPTEKLTVNLAATKLLADAAFSSPLAPWFGFLSRSNSKDLGWETSLMASYQYTADLYFAVGWYHLFVGDGLSDGQFIVSNGLGFTGGSSNDDADIVYFETGITF